MTWVARELPRGSGRWRAVNEPGTQHPHSAPQLECSLCDRVIGKAAAHFLIDGSHVLCGRCSRATDAHARLFPDCPERWHDIFDHPISQGTRAGIAAALGIWPATPPAAKVSFRQWLKRFTGDSSALGDLARDVYADQAWPRGPGSLARYEGYLDRLGADPAAGGTLRTAWARYERERDAGSQPEGSNHGSR